jgi:hypothetical protein
MRSLCRFFAGLAVLAVAIAARAEEGSAGHYEPGSFASFIDVLPASRTWADSDCGSIY